MTVGQLIELLKTKPANVEVVIEFLGDSGAHQTASIESVQEQIDVSTDKINEISLLGRTWKKLGDASGVPTAFTPETPSIRDRARPFFGSH